MKNRFLTIGTEETTITKPKKKQFNYVSKHGKFAKAKTKKSPCAQMQESVVTPDDFTLDVLQFFFAQGLEKSKLNQALREVAANCLWDAFKAANATGRLPAPPNGIPNPTWLVKDSVQLTFRKANNACLFAPVRAATAEKWKAAYEVGLGGSGGAIPKKSVSKTYAQGRYSGAYGAVNYKVEGVPRIMQPSNNTCWAAITTALFGWYHGNKNIKIREFLNGLTDKKYVQLFDQDMNSNGNGRGINRTEERALYQLLGLETIDQFNPTMEAWEGYLKDYGPLSITMAWKDGKLFHAILIHGIQGDGSADGTNVFVLDPAGNLPSKIKFSRFLKLYENGADWPMQIIHFPRGEDMVSTQSLTRQMSLSEIQSIVRSAQFSNIPLDPGTGGRSIGPDSLEVGDIILSTTTQVVSRAIRNMTNSPVSHSMLYIGGEQVVEAVSSGVRMVPIEQALNDASLAVALRDPNLTPNKALQVRDFVGHQLDKPYNHWGIVRQAGFQIDRRAICNRINDARKKARCTNWVGRINLGTATNDEFFCSELILEAYRRAGVPLTRTPPHWNSPDDIAQLQLSRRLGYVGHLIA